jgi:F-type H+-transporting ATPase subunit a
VKETIGAHYTAVWPLVGTVHVDTIYTTWLVMAVVLALLAWVGQSYRRPRVGKTQTIFEGVIEYIADLVHGSLGKSGEPFVPFFVALFIFLFALNQFGVFPFKLFGLPFGGSPTGDLNTTVPYALLIFVVIQVTAFRKQGPSYITHLFKPFPALFVINVIDEVMRPVTLFLRLFFNIFVGEVLFVVVVSVILQGVMIGPFNLSLAAAIVPFFIQFFNFFVGTVQAFIFTLLGVVYLSLATGDEH